MSPLKNCCAWTNLCVPHSALTLLCNTLNLTALFKHPSVQPMLQLLPACKTKFIDSQMQGKSLTDLHPVWEAPLLSLQQFVVKFLLSPPRDLQTENTVHVLFGLELTNQCTWSSMSSAFVIVVSSTEQPLARNMKQSCICNYNHSCGFCAASDFLSPALQEGCLTFISWN